MIDGQYCENNAKGVAHSHKPIVTTSFSSLFSCPAHKTVVIPVCLLLTVYTSASSAESSLTHNRPLGHCARHVEPFLQWPWPTCTGLHLRHPSPMDNVYVYLLKQVLWVVLAEHWLKRCYASPEEASPVFPLAWS